MIAYAHDMIASEMVNFMNGFVSVTFFLTVVSMTCIMVLVLTDRLEINIRMGAPTQYLIMNPESADSDADSSDSSDMEDSEYVSEDSDSDSEDSEGGFHTVHEYYTDALSNKITSMRDMKYVANVCESILEDPIQKLNLSLEDILTLRKLRSYAEVKMKKYLRKTKKTMFAPLFWKIYTGDIPTTTPKGKPEFHDILETLHSIEERANPDLTEEEAATLQTMQSVAVEQMKTMESKPLLDVPESHTVPTFPIATPSPVIREAAEEALSQHAEDGENA